MTISRHVATLNKQLGFIERCAEVAPEGTYQRAKDAAAAIAEASESIMEVLRSYDFEAPGNDTLRNIEAAIYGYLRHNNPDECGLITGEGFGEHIDGPAGERILAQTVRERDELRAIIKIREEMGW